MKNYLLLSVFLLSLANCASNKKMDYIVVNSSSNKEPVWVTNLVKYEKNKDSESNKYKYFRAEGSSIDRRLCQKSALDNTNVTIAGEINTEVENIYNANVNTDEMSSVNDRKEEKSKSTIKNRLSGVEPKDTYWEKRKYSKELGADKEGVIYYCYQLSRVKREVHEKLVNEMVNKSLKDIQNKEDKLNEEINSNINE